MSNRKYWKFLRRRHDEQTRIGSYCISRILRILMLCQPFGDASADRSNQPYRPGTGSCQYVGDLPKYGYRIGLRGFELDWNCNTAARQWFIPRTSGMPCRHQWWK